MASTSTRPRSHTSDQAQSPAPKRQCVEPSLPPTPGQQMQHAQQEHAAALAAAAAHHTAPPPPPPVPAYKLPVTILSGFLGAGKTTLMEHILSTKNTNLKAAIIVNDMASLNIDAELIKKHGVAQADEKVIQLQNGCVCCSLRVDLLAQVAELAASRMYNYLLIEASGISEPQEIAETFSQQFGLQAAQMEMAVAWQTGDAKRGHMAFVMRAGGLPAITRIDTCVTVVDALNMLSELETTDFVYNRPQERGAASQQDPQGEEDERTISELLIAQLEFADVILINKVDLAPKENVEKIRDLIATLNPRAKIIETVRSKVDIREVLLTGRFDMEQAASGVGWLRSLSELTPEGLLGEEAHEHGHEHGHEHEHGEHEHEGKEKHEEKEQHEHGHNGHSYEEHKHEEHKHEVKHEHERNGHSHEKHEHEHKENGHADATGSAKREEQHHRDGEKSSNGSSHGHGHHHHGREGHTQDGFGITSFVYRRRRPFHPGRLWDIVSRKFVLLQKGFATEADLRDPNTDPQSFPDKIKADKAADPALSGLLRSKGFFWLANRNINFGEWGQAGLMLTVGSGGEWWAAGPEEDYEGDKDIEELFHGPYGDRRQEIVMIGNLKGEKRKAVEHLLDDALLNDEEMKEYAAIMDDPNLEDYEKEDRLEELYPREWMAWHHV